MDSSNYNFNVQIKKSNKIKNNKIYLNIFILFIILIIIYFALSKKYLFIISKNNNSLLKIKTNIGIFEIDNIQPENIEREILDKIINKLNGTSLMSTKELYFINGLIRKYRPKKLLEIGVCSGGVSATILNAIKDIEDAMLYSCDLEIKHYLNNNYDVGYIPKQYFSELLNKWKLYLGNTTAAFIEEIGGNIDFVFIDTAHVMPGEVLNMIEILPFLKKNAIIVFDDINHHLINEVIEINYLHTCNNLLFSVLRGKKIVFEQKNNNIFNFSKLGAVILDDNQENYFFEYFYLLSNNWSYMPNKFEIDIIRKIVQKYYKPFFLSMFDKAVSINYQILKKKGLLEKDYISYTFANLNRIKPQYSL